MHNMAKNKQKMEFNKTNSYFLYFILNRTNDVSVAFSRKIFLNSQQRLPGGKVRSCELKFLWMTEIHSVERIISKKIFQFK